jgi:hypothetical protein
MANVRATLAAVLLLLVLAPAAAPTRSPSCPALEPGAALCPHAAATDVDGHGAAMRAAQRDCCTEHASCALCGVSWAPAAPLGSVTPELPSPASKSRYLASMGALVARALDHVPLV